MKDIKILIIEDKYQETVRLAMQEFANQEKNVSFLFAGDLATAQTIIENEKLDGVITDVFFPEETRTGKKSAGFEALFQMLQTMHRFPDQFRYGKILLDDNCMDSISRIHNHGSIQKIDLTHLLGSVSDAKMSERLNQSMVALYGMIKNPDERDQPLGVLINKQMQEKEIPLIVATSGFHHDLPYEAVMLTIRMDTKMNTKILESSNKSDPEFWKKTTNLLLDRIKK